MYNMMKCHKWYLYAMVYYECMSYSHASQAYEPWVVELVGALFVPASDLNMHIQDPLYFLTSA